VVRWSRADATTAVAAELTRSRTRRGAAEEVNWSGEGALRAAQCVLRVCCPRPNEPDLVPRPLTRRLSRRSSFHRGAHPPHYLPLPSGATRRARAASSTASPSATRKRCPRRSTRRSAGPRRRTTTRASRIRRSGSGTRPPGAAARCPSCAPPSPSVSRPPDEPPAECGARIGATAAFGAL
jgi:hypothetical protein